MIAISEERRRSATFIGLLIDDVIAARKRLQTSDTQTTRRDVVRTSLAAMEGLTWVMREHVVAVLGDLEALTPIADLALREISYQVNPEGQVVEQPRTLTLPTAVRLVISQAKLVSPEIEIEFADRGWFALRQSVVIRNRITHPKPIYDLTIGNDDLAVVGSALSWLAATNNYVMASTNLALLNFNDQVREIIERLKVGDPEALSEYQAALESSK